MERALALVVDGDPGVRAVIRDVFEEHEVTVLDAADGDAALELLKTRPVGILLLDFQAPGADGLDVLRGEQRFKDLIERSGIPMGELAHLSE